MQGLEEKPMTERPGDVGWWYARMIGLDKERLPELSELPRKLYFPPQALGKLEEMVLSTLNDNCERGQTIFWKNGRYVEYPVVKGNDHETRTNSAAGFVQAELARNRRAIELHTHPDGSPAFPSKKDWDLYFADYDYNSPTGYFAPPVFVVANRNTVCVAVKTLPSNMSPNVMQDDIVVPSTMSIRRIYSRNEFERNGYMLYFWQPMTEGGKIRNIQKGDLSDGLTVYRMIENPPVAFDSADPENPIPSSSTHILAISPLSDSARSIQSILGLRQLEE